jgi:hypothetical protein
MKQLHRASLIIYVPASKIDAYKAMDGWSTLAEQDTSGAVIAVCVGTRREGGTKSKVVK